MKLPYYITWNYLDVHGDSMTSRRLLNVKKTYDVVFVDASLSDEFLDKLRKVVRPYTLFVENTVGISENFQNFIAEKKGKIALRSDIEYILADELDCFYADSQGSKFLPSSVGINRSFSGTPIWHGGYEVEIDGEYGDNYRQILYWKKNIPLHNNQAIDFWLEYSKDEAVDIELHVELYRTGSVSSAIREWIFNEDDMKNIVTIKNDTDEGDLFISLFVRGQGRMEIKALHHRQSRGYRGYFLPGGQRVVTARREEIFSYFNPGDMKPPLNVFFGDYRSKEGFEGEKLMDEYGSPYLLISDQRLKGGCFFLGDKEYEATIVDIIRKYMYELGFNNDQVIMSGIAMGAYAALYYACDLKPHTVLLGKPLVNIGTVAANETLVRPGGFPASLDIIRFLDDGVSDNQDELIESMNNRIWNKFDRSEWYDTSFIVLHMYEDDYDRTAYEDLIQHIDSENVRLYGIGLHGRHNDNNAGIIKWFKQQYQNVLVEDFGRLL